MRKLTKAQTAWLRKLKEEGPQSRKGHGTTPYHCMRACLTVWRARMPDGKITHIADAQAALGSDWPDKIEWLDGITEAGRKALEAPDA
jgi:hypothetical protein